MLGLTSNASACSLASAGASKQPRQPRKPLRVSPENQLVSYSSHNHEWVSCDYIRACQLLVGSGPSETAHRTLVRVRMKRNGQRWSAKGGQRPLYLRTA